MQKPRKNIYLLVGMFIVSTLAQSLTLIRSAALAKIFGATELMDAFNYANSIAVMLFGVIASRIAKSAEEIV